MLNAITAAIQCLGGIGHSKIAFQVLFQYTHIKKTRVHSLLLYARIGFSPGELPLLGDLFYKTTHSRKRGRKSDISEAVVACFSVIFKNSSRRWEENYEMHQTDWQSVQKSLGCPCSPIGRILSLKHYALKTKINLSGGHPFDSVPIHGSCQRVPRRMWPSCLAQGHRNRDILYLEKFSFYLTKSQLVHCKEQTGSVI
jgi:hypothetical protein